MQKVKNTDKKINRLKDTVPMNYVWKVHLKFEQRYNTIYV